MNLGSRSRHQGGVSTPAGHPPGPSQTTLLVLPSAVLALSFATLATGSQGLDHSLLFGEQGFVELATAGFFVLASVYALTLARGGALPRLYRPAYLAFALAALVVALEEVSWGQHLFGWSSPEWFAEHNHQSETNLHNLLGNEPSDLLRDVAYVVFPAAFVVLPLVAMRIPGAFEADHWTRYLVPRLELVPLVVLSLLATVPNKLPGFRMGGELREVTELFQAWATASFVLVIRARLRARQPSN